jgi:hypothetical protein
MQRARRYTCDSKVRKKYLRNIHSGSEGWNECTGGEFW